MKIRTGFVSNSSSSSFVVFYRPATLDEIDDEDIHIIGDWVCEGEDYFKPDFEIKQFLKSHPILRSRLTLVHEICGLWEEGKTKQDIPEGASYEVFEIDQHTTQDLEEFKSRYIENYYD